NAGLVEVPLVAWSPDRVTPPDRSKLGAGSSSRRNGLRGEVLRFALRPFQPQGCLGIARHAPIAARRQTHRADFWPIRQAGTLELVGEKPLDENHQPGTNLLVS